MRYRLMAAYRGIPYHVGLGPDGNEATLLSPGPPPDELGFAPAGGYWRKQVGLADLDALWQARVVGEYRGEPCLVLDDLGDRLHIAYLGRDPARARQLGYWEIDREVFEVVVGRPDVTGLTEERVDYPLASAMFPSSNRDPGGPARAEVPGHGAQAPGATVFPPGPAGGSAAMPPAAERTSPLRAVPRPGPQPAPEPAGRPPGGHREPASQREPAGYWEPARHPEPGGKREPARAGRSGSRAGMRRRTARRGPRTGWRRGMARPRPSPGPDRRRPGPIPGLTRGWGRRQCRLPGRRRGDVRDGGTGCRSRSSANCSAWPPSPTRPTRSMRKYRALCAWSRPMAVSRCSAGPTTRDSMSASSRTRRRRTSTCSASWRPRRCAAGGCSRVGPTATSTELVVPWRPRPRRKTFRSTYGTRSYPNGHLLQLSLISRRG